jgi:hypothetical protein
MRIRLVGWGVAAVVGLAACGSADRVATRTSTPATTTSGTAANPTGWPKQVRIDFITSCTLTSGGQTDRCGCAADKLSKEIPAAQAESLPPDDPRVQAALKSCSP